MLNLDATPFRAAGNHIGCLLVHGFTGGPWDMRPLAERLADEGYTVALPLLPGHGNENADLGKVGWRDWVAATHDEAQQLRAACTTVVVIGYSMGGATALLAAQQQSPDLLVLLAPALGLTRNWQFNALLRTLPVTKYLRPWFYPLARADLEAPEIQARIRKYAADVNLRDPATQALIRQRVRLATSAIDQFYRLTQRARRLGPRVQVPTLIQHGRLDTTIPPDFSNELYHRLASADKTLHWWEQSGHQLVNGSEREAVIHTTLSWLQTRLPQV